MEERNKILLVDDEEDILEFLSFALKKEGFEVYTATNGLQAIEVAKQILPKLILLDVMMPQMDGVETCTRLRQIKELNDTMIVFLTARGEDYSQIAGFEAGADDYVCKPINPKVLVSRLKAILRRGSVQKEGNDVIRLNDIVIDLARYTVMTKEGEMRLPRKEFQLLVLLASNPNKVFTRDEIYSKVWEDGVIVGERTIDVHIRNLRDHLQIDKIKTYKGVGYKYEEE
jgi:Response regulators consisting of a CheY-like receiver domain and a winged-helix DNA-binding domain